MNTPVGNIEKFLTASVLIFSTIVLIITPWPSANQLFNPHTTPMTLDDLEYRARARSIATNRCFFVVADTATGRAFVTDSPSSKSQILRVSSPHPLWPITL